MKQQADVLKMTKAFQMGEEKGFAYFFNEIHPPLLYFACRILNDKAAAEDVIEDSFIKIWERHSTFTHPKVIKVWLYTTVRNACINLINQNKRRAEHIKIIAADQTDIDTFVLSKMIEAEVVGDIHKLMTKLPTECRKVFYFMYVKGFSARETAGELQLSVSTIKNQKARGLAILRPIAEKMGLAVDHLNYSSA